MGDLILSISFVGISATTPVTITPGGVPSVIGSLGTTADCTDDTLGSCNCNPCTVTATVGGSHAAGSAVGTAIAMTGGEKSPSVSVPSGGPSSSTHDASTCLSAAELSFDLCNVGYDSGPHVPVKLSGPTSGVVSGVVVANVPVLLPGHAVAPLVVTTRARAVAAPLPIASRTDGDRWSLKWHAYTANIRQTSWEMVFTATL